MYSFIYGILKVVSQTVAENETFLIVRLKQEHHEFESRLCYMVSSRIGEALPLRLYLKSKKIRTPPLPVLNTMYQLLS